MSMVDSIGWKPAIVAAPAVWSVCAGLPAGTWKARPAGMSMRWGVRGDGQAAVDDQTPVGLLARLLERRSRRAARRDLGEDVGDRAESGEADQELPLADDPQVLGRDVQWASCIGAAADPGPEYIG
jgi:hypothetical protein